MKKYSTLSKELKKLLIEESKGPSTKDKPKFSLLDPKNVIFRKKYVGTEFPFLGLSLPQEKQVFKKFCSEIVTLDFKERLNFWDFVWKKSSHYHLMGQALLGVDTILKETSLLSDQHKIFKILSSWPKRLDNWAHSDGLSSLLANLLESSLDRNVFLKEHLGVRLKWNQSLNLWERRQSIVSLVYYADRRQRVLDYKTISGFVLPLIEDEAFYVQRGVGWTLRELYNLYPNETFKLLEKNIQKLSSIAFSASTEKLSQKQKDKLKRLRA